jgi:sugar phosphate isomerase/epimerase
VDYLIKRYPGRIYLFHVKDSNANLDQVTVGIGIIDFQTIMKSRKKAGIIDMVILIVETHWKFRVGLHTLLPE